MASSAPSPDSAASGWSVETFQSLLVAFVLAMAFRAYVLEGFVIPTGSMGPTLMGEHVRFRSDQTGYEFAFDAVGLRRQLAQDGPQKIARIYDPMISRTIPAFERSLGELAQSVRFGDRVLVLKSLYPFMAPRRYDVVVFKNPTDPFGETQNYIKRLVGLPDEKILLTDGDVFAGPVDSPGLSGLAVQRKPEYIQRAVWQPVYDLDYQPVNVTALEELARHAWPGIPWQGAGWDTSDPRAWRWAEAGRGEIVWDLAVRNIDDWNAYNMLLASDSYSVSDIRVAATVAADDPQALRMKLTLQARNHAFDFEIADGQARVSMTRDGEEAPSAQDSGPVSLGDPGEAVPVEFWQVDQSMSIYVDGERVAYLEYDWTVPERIAFSYHGMSVEDFARHTSRQPTSAKVHWSFDGSPVTVRCLRLDRDLYYRPGEVRANDQFISNGPLIRGLAFATDPLAPAVLGPDQFLMLGDNSAASRDGRTWGRPHPLVAIQVGEDAPFVVPRELLLGKACAVYFPAPMPLKPGWRKVIPDFGRLRFIR